MPPGSDAAGIGIADQAIVEAAPAFRSDRATLFRLQF
jgi:hypothetical protein